MVKGSFSFNSRRTEDERPFKNYPQKLTTQSQKSFESHLSSTLMRVKLVMFIVYYKELEDSVNQRHPSIILVPVTLESLQLEVE